MQKRVVLCLLVLISLLAMLLSACSDDEGEPDTQASSANPIEWNRDPAAIILRLDERPNEAGPVELGNHVPPCTLWGDGRLVWTNRVEDENQVLEARLSDEQVRALIWDNVIRRGFYDWESDFILIGEANPTIRSISLDLYSESYTVARYSDWPVDGYEAILRSCADASDAPVRFAPDGGWLRAYPIPYQDGYFHWAWPGEAVGFAMRDVVEQPRWITGALAGLVWQNIYASPSPARVLHEDQAYEVVFQVPGIMRDAPPRPAESE